jgi:hypothetical protein
MTSWGDAVKLLKDAGSITLDLQFEPMKPKPKLCTRCEVKLTDETTVHVLVNAVLFDYTFDVCRNCAMDIAKEAASGEYD